MTEALTFVELRQRIEDLERALEPFAQCAEGFPRSRSDGSYVFSTMASSLTVGQFRYARRIYDDRQ